MRKKILFVIPEYSHGGTNKSLENLLHFLDEDKYEVSIICLYEDGGDLYKKAFRSYIVRKSLLYRLAHDNRITRKVMGLLIRTTSMTFDWLYRYEASRLQAQCQYDIVVAYQEGTATRFVSMMEGAHPKIAWVHCCYEDFKKNVSVSKELSIYEKFDNIVSVSKCAVGSFARVFPQLSERLDCIYNTINADEIKFSGNADGNPYGNNDGFVILSVGRFVRGKQFYLIPGIVRKLKKLTDRNFCWYVIGDGANREEVIKEVEETGLGNVVKIIGARDNPYPYFKNADLHVCTSASESFSYTIAESKILHIPVLCNDLAVSREVVQENEGWICPVEDMPRMLKDIIEDTAGIYSRVKTSLANYEYPNEEALKKVDNLFDVL